MKWNLRVLMADRGVKNKDLAKAVGIDPTVLSRHRKVGYCPQKLDTAYLERLCAELDCGISDLLVLED